MTREHFRFTLRDLFGSEEMQRLLAEAPDVFADRHQLEPEEIAAFQAIPLSAFSDNNPLSKIKFPMGDLLQR